MRLRHLALAFALAPACATPAVMPEDVVLSTQVREIVFPLRPLLVRQVVLDVLEVANPRRVGVTILVEDDGTQPNRDRISLYPPDAPGRFPMRLSPGATNLNLKLIEPRGDRSPVRVRLTIRPD